jgi:hypothetical protein
LNLILQAEYFILLASGVASANGRFGSISAIELRVRHERTCFDTGRQRAQLLDCIRLLQPSMVGSITPATGAPL